MKIAFMSSDPISLRALEFVRAAHELVCVVSNPDRPKGRGKKLSPNEVSQWALESGVELLRPEGAPGADVSARMSELGAELVLVMAYGRILKDNILNLGKYPCLNLHASILPELRGASPVETAIALGKTRTGVSLMAVSPELDAGDVAAVEEVEISSDDTAHTLREKISRAAAESLRKNLPLLREGKLRFAPQDSPRATYARKLCKDDMRLDFRAPAETVRNRVRAFGAGIFEFENIDIKILSAEVLDAETEFCQPGKILRADSCGLKIACARGAILARTLQRPCCKAMCARDFFAGFKMGEGLVLKSAENKPLLR